MYIHYYCFVLDPNKKFRNNRVIKNIALHLKYAVRVDNEYI